MVQMEVELPKSATIRDLKKLVGERMGVNPAKVSIQSLRVISFNNSYFPQKYSQESFTNIIPIT
jgi:hypothetical protein